MSKRNIYLLTIGIITVICIIAGSIIHLNNYSIFNFNSDKEGNFSDSIIVEEFQDIEIEGKVLGVKIKGSDNKDASIHINCNKEKLFPEVYVEGGSLIIKQDNTGSIHGNSNCNVVITVPYDFNLNEVEMDLNVGAINISDIYADTIDITTNVGEIKLDNVEFMELDGKTNVGEISVDGIGKELEEFNISLSTNVGKVTVGNNKLKKSYSQKGSSSKQIELCTNVGEIKIM